MEVTEITFNIKDVITIIVGVSSFTGFYYALKRSVDKVSNDLDALESKHKKESEAIMNSLADQKREMKTSEEHIYEKIAEIRNEQKAANDKLETKIDVMSTHITSIGTALAELTGYIKAKKP